MTLPTDAKARKAVPLFTGCLNYFPNALAAVAELSRVGNEQHNPGQPLHWDRAKSTDEADALARHLLEHGTIDTDGQRHSTKLAWRALALLQKEIENDQRRGDAIRPPGGELSSVAERDHDSDGRQRAFLATGGTATAE